MQLLCGVRLEGLPATGRPPILWKVSIQPHVVQDPSFLQVEKLVLLPHEHGGRRPSTPRDFNRNACELPTAQVGSVTQKPLPLHINTVLSTLTSTAFCQRFAWRSRSRRRQWSSTWSQWRVQPGGSHHRHPRSTSNKTATARQIPLDRLAS